MSIANCSDDRAAWINRGSSWSPYTAGLDTLPEALEVSYLAEDGEHEEGSASVELDISGPPIEVDWERLAVHRGFTPHYDLFLPATLLEEIEAPAFRADVIGPPGREFVAAVNEAAEARGWSASVWSYSE